MEQITSKQFFKMLNSATNNLLNNQQKINDYNVFPIPDGDTGTNMAFTLKSGMEKVNQIGLVHGSVANIMTYFAQGALLGARGNSGVITSQIFKGMSLGLADEEEMGIEQLVEALNMAKDVAYKSVSNPVEGTILTVIREVAHSLDKRQKKYKDLIDAFEFICKKAKESVEKTPTLLKILRETGVIDSGAYGLELIFEGMLEALKNNDIKIETLIENQNNKITQSFSLIKASAHENIGYCNEFILTLKEPIQFNREKTKTEISQFGNSLILINDEDVLKIHIHAKEPGKVIAYLHQFGEFSNIKVENMTTQVAENEAYQTILKRMKTQELNVPKKKEVGLIAVTNGKGLKEEFKNLNVDFIIKGGQTLNPSTLEFIEAIKSVNAKKIIILPNNPNIFFAAKQAAAQFEKDFIYVVETNTMLEGFVACYYYDTNASAKDNLTSMREAIKGVISASITKATRNWNKGKISVIKDDRIAIVNNEIIGGFKNDYQGLIEIYNKFKNKDVQIITIYKGKDYKEEDLLKFQKWAKENAKVEIEYKNGGQYVYSYLVQIEI